MKLWTVKKYLLPFIVFSCFFVNILAEENKKVVVAVDSRYSFILGNEIKTYVKDLAAEGWSVEVTYPSYLGSSDLAELLKSWKHEFNMDGVVLIGLFPYTDDPSMGNLNPLFNRLAGGRIDFWISRIDPGLIKVARGEDEIVLLREYFYKNHRYRGEFKYEDRTTVIGRNLSCFDQFLNNSAYLLSLGTAKVFSVIDKEGFLNQVNDSDSLVTEIRFHGNVNCLVVGSSCISATNLLLEFKSKSKFIDLQSCYGGSPYVGNIATALLFSPKSKVLAVLARPGISWFFKTLSTRNYSSCEKTAGDVFVSHNLPCVYILEKLATYIHYYQFNSYDSRILLGDGTLRLTN